MSHIWLDVQGLEPFGHMLDSMSWIAHDFSSLRLVMLECAGLRADILCDIVLESGHLLGTYLLTHAGATEVQNM